MIILNKSITRQELETMADNFFDDFVKAVVDVKQQLVALDAELHSDLEAFLLEKNSKQNDLWGINLYPEIEDDDFIEFDSMINMRPSLGNRSRGVDDENLRIKIREVIDKWIIR